MESGSQLLVPVPNRAASESIIKSQKKRKMGPEKSIKSLDKNSKKKKVELCNGFTVETSLTNETYLESGDLKIKQNQRFKGKTGGEQKIKLGEKSISGNELTIEGMGAWSYFQIPEEILKALGDQNFQTPTKIQELTLPSAILGRRDILGAAETGSGKTLSFGIPILTGIMKLKKKVDRETDEGNDSDDIDDYIHLSEMFDSDYAAETDDDELNYECNTKENEDKEGSEDENEISLDECASEDNGSNHIEGSNDSPDTTIESGVGCVKVIYDIDMPPHVIPKTEKPLYALILTPTRELAIQVSRHLAAAAKYTGIKIATLVGGMAHVKQERILSRGPEVVVATPGRLWELIQQGQRHLQQLENIKFLAIDETDRMVEKNHFEELHPLLEKINSDEARKSSRQNFVYSATLTLVHDLPAYLKVKKVTKRGKILNRKIEKMTPQQKVKKLVDMIGMTDPKVVDITAHNSGTAETLTECRIACALDQKDHYLYYVLKKHPGRAIVFCNSIGSVKRLAQLFGLLKCRPLPLHASMPQRQRLKNLERFRDDPHGVLIATDVAARGLDIPDVDHVIHYQVPRTAENYVHRSGRTARASKEGLTILMMEPGEAYLYAKLCRTLNKKSELPIFPVPGHVLSSMREVVSLAREVDKLQLQHRRTAQEQGWIDKAAQDMDFLVDEDFLPRKTKDDVVGKKLQLKKKQLQILMDKPMFPRGFSFKYPTLNDLDALLPKVEENALQVMKNALQSGELKKQKRKSKNAPLLNLEKQMKHQNKFN